MASGKKPQLQLLLRPIIIRIMVLGMGLMVADRYTITSSLSSMMGRL